MKGWVNVNHNVKDNQEFSTSHTDDEYSLKAKTDIVNHMMYFGKILLSEFSRSTLKKNSLHLSYILNSQTYIFRTLHVWYL